MIVAALALLLSQAQVASLNMAYTYGEHYGLAKTFQAVVLVESSGCLHESGDKGASLGCSQIQVYTARQTCGCEVTERDLLDNREWNLSIGAKFLSRCFDKFWPDRNRAIYCFNRGIPAASKATNREVNKSQYVQKVLRAESQLESLRKDTE